MKKNLLILFVIVLILTGGYLILNKIAPDRLSNVIPCFLLTEEQCKVSDKCRTHYESKGYDCPPDRDCPQGMRVVYEGCKRITK